MVEFYDYMKFRDYLNSLDGPKPFECPNLKVLLEDVYNKEAGKTYEKGTLICAATPGTIGNTRDHTCRINDSLRQIDEGVYQFKCSWNGSVLTIKGAIFYKGKEKKEVGKKEKKKQTKQNSADS